MLTAKDIREKRFEKASWGYRPEDIDEFLGQIEASLQEYENEREDSNHKITVLAEKVREYMKDEEAIKDALLGAQKEGRRIVAEANEKAEQIISKAKEEAAALIDETTRQHEELLERNHAEITREQDALAEARRLVAEFKRSLFDMYKGHLEMISALPEEDDAFPAAAEPALPNPPAPAVQEDGTASSYDARFGDIDKEPTDLSK